MNGDWLYFTEPPPQWAAVCQARRSLFHTAAWQELLQNAFGAAPLFAMRPAGDEDATTFALTVFPAGPFRLGYIGFPAGGAAGFQPLSAAMVNSLAISRFPRTIHLLKIVSSPFPEMLSLPYAYAETWETMIPDLREWREETLPANVRRNLRKARKNKVQIRQAEKSEAPAIFHLYRETVQRHGGMARYGLAYFSQLLELSQEVAGLPVWLALVNDEIAAFLAAAREGATVFYLHGAVNRHLQQFRPGDLLFYTAICWARDEGAREFNMMASPLSQLSLVRYKEKWGGVTAVQRTYTLPLQPLPAAGFRLAAALLERWWKWKSKLSGAAQRF